MSVSLQGDAGKSADYLLQHFWASVIGLNIPVDSVLSPEQRLWMLRELTRQDEVETAYGPDERLTWRAEHLPQSRLELIERPILDELAACWRRKLSTLDLKQSAEPIWPDGKPFALCVTHEMDYISSYNVAGLCRRAYRYAGHPKASLAEVANVAVMSGWSMARKFAARYLLRRPDSLSRVAEWMRMEDDLGFRSTFLFFPSTVRLWHPSDCDYSFRDHVLFDGHRLPVGQMMREIVRWGWDVGLHSSYYSATVPGLLQQQKEEMERVLGCEVITTRQHTLQYDPKLTPILQAQAGIVVDSTQGFNDLVGFRAGTSFPYLCWNWQKMTTLPLLEIPLHIQDGPLLRASSSEDEALATCCKLLDSVQSVGGCLAIVWHPHWLQTPIGMGVFRGILQEARSRNAWGCSLRQLAEWWLSRSRRILSQPTVHLETEYVSALHAARHGSQECREVGAFGP